MIDSAAHEVSGLLESESLIASGHRNFIKPAPYVELAQYRDPTLL